MSKKNNLSHVNQRGEAHMVGVSAKPETYRRALCDGWVLISEEAFAAIRDDNAKKGDVIATARIAGLMAVKKTADLIPLCHPLRISKAEVNLEVIEFDSLPEEIQACRPDAAAGVYITASAEAMDRTGVEMEAMTALSVTALTTYDMLKAVDRFMVTTQVRLLEKSGGKSGEWRRNAQ